MSLYELNQRYAEIALRDDVGFVATINPITLETGFTPQSLVDVTALLSSTDRRKDWDRLADEAAKYCDDIEGIGLLQSIDQARSGLELLQAQAAGNAPAIDQAQRSLYGHMYSDGLFVRAAHDALDHIGQLDPKRQPEAYQSAQAAREMLEDVVEGQLRSAIQTTLTPATRAEVALWVEDKLGHVFEAIDNSARFPPPAVVTELQRAITLLPQFESSSPYPLPCRMSLGKR